MAELKHFMIYF